MSAAAPEAPDLAGVVRKGVRLFDHGRYLAAQQVWEGGWREAPPADRAFLEGLVQLAGGLHLRTRRGVTRGAVHLVSQAMIHLDDYRPAAYGIDVERLLAEFTAYLDWVKATGRPHRVLDRQRIPRIGDGARARAGGA